MHYYQLWLTLNQTCYTDDYCIFFCLLFVQFIFKRDLRWCPMFTKLKILLLNDYWCVPDDFHLLACILKQSPVLEKLTIQSGTQVHSL